MRPSQAERQEDAVMEFQASTSFSRSQGGNEPPQPPGIAVSTSWRVGCETHHTCIPICSVQATL